MDGPILLPAMWLFAMGCAWIYRRHEKVSVRHPGFEEWAAKHPTMLRVRCTAGSAREVGRALEGAFAKAEVVCTLGRPPIQFYSLRLETKVSETHVDLVLGKASLLRARVTPNPLFHVAHQALRGHESEVLSLWAEERAFLDNVNDVVAPHGWKTDISGQRWQLAPATEADRPAAPDPPVRSSHRE